MWSAFTTYSEQARHIIDQNKYMVIATVDSSGHPWATPVFFAYDKGYNLYFISAVESLHVKNIGKNHNVSVAIFDSSQPIGSSDLVQALGTAKVLSGSDIKPAIETYCARLFSNSSVSAKERYDPSFYKSPSEFRIFQISLFKIYTNRLGRRTEVDLKK